MAAQKEIAITGGPDEQRNHVDSTVIQAPTEWAWVSTIGLPWRRGAYETLVFPIPPSVELGLDAERKPVFSEDFPLFEGGCGPNTTNIQGKRAARRVHGETVQAVVRRLEEVARAK